MLLNQKHFFPKACISWIQINMLLERNSIDSIAFFSQFCIHKRLSIPKLFHKQGYDPVN